jgi:predicted O-linked N-acetylglucosamine transferase (SPINDLY family)
LDELVVQTHSDYESLAISLAQSPERLGAIRVKLAANKKTKPLFDTARYTRNLERAFAEMHGLASRGEGPRTFHVSDAT